MILGFFDKGLLPTLLVLAPFLVLNRELCLMIKNRKTRQVVSLAGFFINGVSSEAQMLIRFGSDRSYSIGRNSFGKS